MDNVISLSEYRARKERRPDRIALGTPCMYGDRPATVVGTWTFTGLSGPPGSVETRKGWLGNDPKLDTDASGYLLLPCNGGGFIHSFWGDVAIGTLSPIS